MSTSDLGSTLPGGSRTRRASIILLGKEVEVDPLVLSRVERAERAAAVLMVITLVTYALNGASNVFLSVLTAISSTAFFFSLFVVYYKNFSFAIVKRLFKEVEHPLALPSLYGILGRCRFNAPFSIYGTI